jgi:UDP-glucose 4-epimerase
MLSLPDDVAYFRCDIRNRDFIKNALRGVDEIVDLAYPTVPKTSYENPLLDFTDNRLRLVGRFELVCDLPVKILFISSGGICYGEPKSLPITEGNPANPISAYGIAKIALENMLRCTSKQVIYP